MVWIRNKMSIGKSNLIIVAKFITMIKMHAQFKKGAKKSSVLRLKVNLTKEQGLKRPDKSPC